MDGFRTQQDEISAEVRDLERLYEENLRKLEASSIKDGELKRLLAVQAELEGFRTGSSPEADGSLPEFQRLQSIYRETHADRLKAAHLKIDSVAGSYREQLQALEASFTRQEKIEEALKVSEAIKDLEVSAEGLYPTLSFSWLAAGGPTVEGFDFGAPGKVRGFGALNSEPLDISAAEGIDNAIRVSAAHLTWTVLTQDGGLVQSALDFDSPAAAWPPKGEIRGVATGRRGGGVIVTADGLVHTLEEGTINPESYGGGRITHAARGIHQSILGLREDGTLALISTSNILHRSLKPHLSKVEDVVAVEAAAYIFAALTADGKVHMWRALERDNIGWRTIRLRDFGKKIVAITSAYAGFVLLDAGGEVWQVDIHDGKAKYSKPKGGLSDIVRIWSGGRCGAALDRNGRVHAWGRDFAQVGLLEKLESLTGIKDLAIMDHDRNGVHSFALWIE